MNKLSLVILIFGKEICSLPMCLGVQRGFQRISIMNSVSFFDNKLFKLVLYAQLAKILVRHFLTLSFIPVKSGHWCGN